MSGGPLFVSTAAHPGCYLACGIHSLLPDSRGIATHRWIDPELQQLILAWQRG